MAEKNIEVITIPYIVYENSENRHEKKEKRTLWCIIIPLILALFLSNMAWLYVFQSYDYVSETTEKIVDTTNGGNAVINGEGEVNINGESNSENSK